MNAGEESEGYEGEDLDEILQRIQDYHGLWKVIGVELGIEMDVLNLIEMAYRHDIDCLHALIIQWPHGDNSSLTYQALVKAFQSERVSDAKAGTVLCNVPLGESGDHNHKLELSRTHTPHAASASI